jgi:hypothetical protein
MKPFVKLIESTFGGSKLLLVALTFLFSIASCQVKKKQPEVKAEKNTVQPKVDIKVNRRYDDKGNLIGFDSTYSSYYSTHKGDTVLMDSLFKKFDFSFNRKYPSILDEHFGKLFFEDSLLYHDFFHEDFFRKRYELNDPFVRKEMLRMDSIKNEFFKRHSKEKPSKNKKK